MHSHYRADKGGGQGAHAPPPYRPVNILHGLTEGGGGVVHGGVAISDPLPMRCVLFSYTEASGLDFISERGCRDVTRQKL